MSRILFWNVNNFSLTKIHDPANPLQARTRQRYMRRVFERHIPDIIVIVEVTAPNDIIWDGIVLNEQQPGLTGALTLLADMRAHMAAEWCLVPPLTLGDGGVREFVAVFFNSNVLQFTGPWIWTNNEVDPPPALVPPPQGADIARSTAPNPNGHNVIGNYPEPWFNTLPAAQVNINSPHNAGIPQNQCAAQYRFWNINGNELFFPNGRPWWGVGIGPPQSRAPYLTTFYDQAGNKTINLYSVHTSPPTAAQAVQNIAHINGIGATPPHHLTVIAGDFNVDSMDANNYGLNGYGPLLAAGFELRIVPNFNGAAPDPNSRPYCMTHLLPLPAGGVPLNSRATPYNDSAPPGNTPNLVQNLPALGNNSPGGGYPSYGAMGSTGGQGFHQVTYRAAIDNFLTQYGGGTAMPPAAFNTTIINPISGSPYNAIPAPALGIPIGHYDYPSQLHNPIPIDGVGRPGDQPFMPELTQFLQWLNFGVIHNTSDHLPIITDV